MSCANSTRHLLQPLIRSGAVSTSISEPLPFLYPRALFPFPLCQPGSSTNFSVRKTRFLTGAHRSFTSDSSKRSKGDGNSDSVSELASSRNELQNSRIDEPSSKNARANHKPTDASGDSFSVATRGRYAKNTVSVSVNSLISSLLSEVKTKVDNIEADEPTPIRAGETVAAQSTEPEAPVSQDEKLRIHYEPKFGGVYVKSLKHEKQKQPMVFPKLISPQPDMSTAQPPPKHSHRSKEPQTDDLRKLVEQHLINRSAKEWVNSEIRWKHQWSYDWIGAVSKLFTALQSSAEEGVKDEQAVPPADDAPSIALLNNDYIGVFYDDIPVPPEWTKLSFAQYVHDLCRSRMPLALNRVSHKKHGSYHHELVRKHLLKTLFVPSNALLMSSTAFESAIRFFYRYEFMDSVQLLFAFMKDIEFPYPNTCFDLVLRNSATRKDLHNFTALLQAALQLGFAPSGTTWASLHMCVESERAAQVVFDLMESNKLLSDIKVRRDLATDMLRREFSHTAIGTIDVDTILEHMGTCLGDDWLFIRSANVILKYLCMAPSESDITSFLERLYERGIPPNIDSLNLLILRRLRLQRLDAALKDVVHFHDNFGVIPDTLTYTLLFRLAWKKRSQNVCRVLWAAACLHFRVSRTVEDTLHSSIAKGLDETTSQGVWKSTAGLLIIDLGLKETTNDSLHQNVPEPGNPRVKATQDMQSILSWLSGPRTSSQMPNQIKAARSLMQDDEQTHGKVKYPLIMIKQDLAKALEMDLQWKIDEVGKQPLSVQRGRMIKPSLTYQTRNHKSASKNVVRFRSRSTQFFKRPASE